MIWPPPQRYGLAPDGDPPAPDGINIIAAGFTLGEAVRSGPFWAIYPGCMLLAFGALLGSAVAGYAYDFFGSYTGAILAGAALCFVSFFITLLTPEPSPWQALRTART